MKAKIERIPDSEAKTAKLRLDDCLEAATKKQLAYTVCALSENIIQITTEVCDHSTNFCLSAELVCALLCENNERETFPYQSPNKAHISDLATTFGVRRGVLNESVEARRIREIKLMLGKI